MVTGDDFNQVCVFKYPSVKYGSKAVVCNGHSTAVSNVKFSLDD